MKCGVAHIQRLLYIFINQYFFLKKEINERLFPVCGFYDNGAKINVIEQKTRKTSKTT